MSKRHRPGAEMVCDVGLEHPANGGLGPSQGFADRADQIDETLAHLRVGDAVIGTDQLKSLTLGEGIMFERFLSALGESLGQAAASL